MIEICDFDVGISLHLYSLTLANDIAHMRSLQERLEAGLRAALPAVHVYGAQAERLPNTSCLRFGTLDAEQVLGKLERAGVLASSGAACTAGGTQPSHVLLAMGESALNAKASVRLSTGRDTQTTDIDRAIAAAALVIGPLLQPLPVRAEPVEASVHLGASPSTSSGRTELSNV